MNWLFYTIFAILSRATYGVSTKVLSDNVKLTPIAQTLIFSVFSTILTLIISPFIGGISFNDFASVWLLMLILVICMSLANVIYFIGIKTLDSSTTQIAFSSILIWGTVLSVFTLNSNFSAKQITGILILFLAIFMAQFQNKLKLNRGVVYIGLSAALFAIFQVTSARLVQTISAGTYLLTAYLGSTIVLAVTSFPQIKPAVQLLRNNIHSTLKIMLFSSITGILYFIFSYYAYRDAPDSGVVVLLLTTQVIVAVILSIFFLNERRNMGRKILAGIIAVLAGLLIKG